jgi:hypothetical protein
MTVHLLLLPIFYYSEAFDPVIGVQQHVLFFCQNLDSVDTATNNFFPGVLIFLIDVNYVHVAQHVGSIQSTFPFVPCEARVHNFLRVL